MLDKVQKADSGPLSEVTEVYLHVQTNNDDALTFYKSAGFTVGEILKV
jgi:ribosomal protein S18 acetylase RimI-like enzyme